METIILYQPSHLAKPMQLWHTVDHLEYSVYHRIRTDRNLDFEHFYFHLDHDIG